MHRSGHCNVSDESVERLMKRKTRGTTVRCSRENMDASGSRRLACSFFGRRGIIFYVTSGDDFFA